MEQKKKKKEGASEGLFHVQTAFGTAFTFLTGGVFLSGLAIYMGADDLLISYISMITNICGISILFFSAFMERFQSYKKITIGLTIISKFTTLLIVLIPLVVSDSTQILIFVPLMVLAFTLQAQTTVLINNWMVTFVDEKQSGRYIARRQTIVLAITVFLSLIGGRLLDAVSGAYIGFLILFFAAFLMALVEVTVLLRTPDAIRKKSGERICKYKDMVRIPLKNREYRRYIIYIFFFYLMLTVADSFTVVYMMRYLKLSYLATTAMQMIISLPQIFLLGMWGKISDSKGHRFALTASIWFFIGETFFMAFSNSGNFYIFIPIAFFFAAIGNAGFTVSVFNRRYELIPKEGRILYDNFYSAAIGLAFILGPFVGGTIKKLLESGGSVNFFMQFGSIRMLYIVSTFAIILLQCVVYLLNRRNGEER